MKKFKTIIFTLLLVLTINLSFCQVTKFKTSSSASSYFDEKTKKWSDWEEAENGKDILIAADFTNDRIKIYSKVEQVFDIIESFEKTTDEDNDEIFGFDCIDKEGSKCTLRFLILKSQENRRQLYIGYSDVTFLYNIYNLD